MIVPSVKVKAERCGLFKAGIRHDVSEQFLNPSEACFSSFVSVLRLDFLKFFGGYFTIHSNFWQEIYCNSTIYLSQQRTNLGMWV